MKLGAAMMTKKLKRGSSSVGELKLADELASQGPYVDRRSGAGMRDDVAAGVIMEKRMTRALDSAEATRTGMKMKMENPDFPTMKKIGKIKRKP